MPASKLLSADASLPAVVCRINGLINDMHRGSVNAAAKECGVPQRTLARITKGSLPRTDVIERVARFYGCSADWLLTGRGEGPTHIRFTRQDVAVLRALAAKIAALLPPEA